MWAHTKDTRIRTLSLSKQTGVFMLPLDCQIQRLEGLDLAIQAERG